MRQVLAGAALLVLVTGCEAPNPTDPDGPVLAAGGIAHQSNGAGRYDIAGLIVRFRMNASADAIGGASGSFRHRVELGAEVVDFAGRVTCLTVDPVNKRAWIGGVITDNRSTEPSFQTPIHQPGKDIWFRVVDYGNGPDAPPDRSTFTGFEGGGGIITSAEYCDAQIWPDDDARTWPVIQGAIRVR